MTTPRHTGAQEWAKPIVAASCQEECCRGQVRPWSVPGKVEGRLARVLVRFRKWVESDPAHAYVALFYGTGFVAIVVVWLYSMVRLGWWIGGR